MNKRINVSSVYCVLNIYTNRRYVGSTTKFSKRKTHHLYDLRNKIHSSKLLQEDYEKYGEDSLKFFILEDVETFNLDELINREQYWIDKYKPEYNVNQIAGYRFPKKTEEAKDRIRKRMTGRKQSQEEKDRRAESIKKFWATHPAKTIPQEMREHLSKINTGKRNPNWGLKRTPEQLKRQGDGRANTIYTFKSPEGNTVSFRRITNSPIPLSYSTLRKLVRGVWKESKGWTFVKSELTS